MIRANPSEMRFLIVGWFSVEEGAATAGDLLSLDLACEWVESAGYSYDVALAAPFRGGVDVSTASPWNYSHLLFVCGPLQPRWFAATLCRRFRHCRFIALNVTLPVPLDSWNPFDGLVERDSSVRANADIAFLSTKPLVPVVGVCLVEPYENAMDHAANAAIERLLATREVSVVPIDTRLDVNGVGLRTAMEVESLLARMDVVVTTRLHGTVLALKNGVPVIAIDPEAGGAKVRRQAASIGWPIVFNADDLPEEALKGALEYCLSDAGRKEAQQCGERAKRMAEAVRSEFITMLENPEELDGRYLLRVNSPADEDWIVALERGGAEMGRREATTPSSTWWIRRTLKRAAWWTLPTPIYCWLRAKGHPGRPSFAGDTDRET